MSGGHLDYFCFTLEDHAGDFGDKELDALVKDLAYLFHDREWYLSGDTSEGEWNEARDKFKSKWFTKAGRTDRIEKYLDEMVEEFKRIFGIGHKECQNCRHFTQYKPENCGKCDLQNWHLVHRSEWCDKWECKPEEELVFSIGEPGSGGRGGK